MGHANSLYLPQIHVPLIISYPPQLPGGRHINQVVSLADLPATLVDLLSLAPANSFPGTSLMPLLAGEAGNDDSGPVVAEVSPKPSDRMERGDRLAPIARGEMRSAVTPGLHYVLNGDGIEELYNYIDDPDETRNLIDQLDEANQLQRLRNAVKYPTNRPPSESVPPTPH